MKYLLRKKISNHPVLTDVERYAELDSYRPVASAEIFEAYGTIVHEKSGAKIAEMNKPFRLVADKHKTMFDRNLEDFSLLEDEDGNPVEISGFDLVVKMFDAGVADKLALDYFISNADAAKEFD